MYEVQRVAIDKICWKAKMKDWGYMSAINIWDNVQNYFNNEYIANNKRKKNSWKKVYNRMSSSNVFQNPKNVLFKEAHH